MKPVVTRKFESSPRSPARELALCGRHLRLAPLAALLLSTSPVLWAQQAPSGQAPAAATPAPAAAAASSPPLAASAPTGAVQEIVVTAEKRSSSIQKTPISITAVSGAALQEKGVVSVIDLAREIPGVAAKNAGPGQTEFTLRGMSSSAGVSPTAGFYLDEIPVSPPAISTPGHVAIDPDLYDLARVEVLRGPQGTLYGSGSMGGTIKLIPEAPDLSDRYGSVQIVGSKTQGGGANGTFNAMINAPLIDNTVALRAVLTRRHAGGWIDRIVASDMPLAVPDSSGSSFGSPRADVLAATQRKSYENANAFDLTSGRLSLLIKPSAQLKITPSVYYQKIDQGSPDNYDVSPGRLAHYQPFDVPESFNDTFAVYGLKVEYNFESATLTSITSSARRNGLRVEDQSEVMQKALGLPGYAAVDGGVGAGDIEERQRLHQMSQELRLQSRGSGPLNWTMGLFYSRFKSRWVGDLTFPDAAAAVGTTDLYSARFSDVLTQAALFGNVSYDVTPQLRATAGGRYFQSKDVASTSSGGLFGAGTTDDVSAKASGFNPMVNLAYTVNADSMFYATAAKGFRDGAAQQNLPAGCAADLAALGLTRSPPSYGPDTVWSYELGAKNRFFDRSLVVNAAVYQQRWSAVQQQIILPNCGYIYTDNAADATINGFELELTARVGAGFTVEQAVGLARARFSTTNAASGTAKGDRLLNVPDWTASTNLRYETALADDRKLVARLGVSYTGGIESLQRGVRLPSYTLANARIGVHSSEWSASVFVDNITNRQADLAFVQSGTFNTPGLQRHATNRPRTVGLDLSRQF